MSMIDFAATDSEEDLTATDSENEDPNYSIATDSEEEDPSDSTENENSDTDEEVSEEMEENCDEEDSDDEEESQEYQSFCQHSSQLLRVISNPENFAKRLFSAHIISDRVLSDIQKLRRARHGINKKTKKLLKIVKGLIQADPGKFEALLEVMSQYSSSRLAAMAVKMKRNCGRLSFYCFYTRM